MAKLTKSQVQDIYTLQGTMEVRVPTGNVTLDDIPGFGACDICGKKEPLPFRCERCWGVYCLEHHMPWNHNCDEVIGKKYEEEERRKQEEKRKREEKEQESEQSRRRLVGESMSKIDDKKKVDIYTIPGSTEVISSRGGNQWMPDKPPKANVKDMVITPEQEAEMLQKLNEKLEKDDPRFQPRSSSAEEARKYQQYLAQKREERKLINRIKRFLGW